MSFLPSSGTVSMETASRGLTDTPEPVMPPFTSGQCLFCPKFSPDFTNSVIHMQKSHGLFVPSQQHLVVDPETLFKYLHLIVFGYRECLQCGRQRATVQAIQQHMTSKGHCKFDISEQDSEFTEFYDFSGPKNDIENGGKGNGQEEIQKESSAGLNRKSLLVDEDSLLLPSGRIASKKFSVKPAPPFSRFLRQSRELSSQPRHALVKPDTDKGSSKVQLNPGMRNIQPLLKREERNRADASYHKANMQAKDRRTLMHLSPSQQRSMITTQHRCEEKTQIKEGRKQTRLDQKGNKNLYAYWATETPVYQCG
ncbi:C2H2 type zinc-finger-domain-containing protein [Colletotrichum navitas]|uniref:C2H2 type zinc-finger-domain-containing protein n=1 Tax=Colletotrichum navitas TaxID=681940 RepID=A0AAD8PXC0_9PEZI|nr:C2H2 type zinc-finger-domain-containing protein [Colletotrichum navitas]KAK1585900.1 C2H2 type zinc-finger-domain-containing protein [Colletotrichum navitas]